MINYTTAIVNNKFQVTFDFTPDDVRYSRGNYTAVHRASGRTDRQGIWEGVECVEAQIKINGTWKTYSLPSNKKVVIEVSSNNTQIQAYGKYRIKTQGFHWLDTTGTYPFFWYGNVGGNPNRYQKGYFTNGSPAAPDVNFKNISAMVPADWNFVRADWTDWAYKHSKATGNYTVENGRYEQRNGSYEAATNRNGWISDSNRKQMWRKSCLFWFDKDYYSNTITSSGIAVNPSVPRLEVYPAKGDSGQVKLTYLDPSGKPGRVKLLAYCAGKTHVQDDFYVSGHFNNGGSYTYTVDFNRAFGESYRANDVYYEAWTKNDYGYISPSTGRKGIQRYNGRPSVPTGLTVYGGDNNLIYNRVNFKWNKSSDPDGDAVVYDLWLKVTNPAGNVLCNDFIARGVNDLKYNLNIANYDDGSDMEIKVRASDNLITSDWCSTVKFKKGAKPTNHIDLILPLKINNNLYSKNPRFCFEGYDGESEAVIILNGVEYSSDKNPDMFALSSKRFIFKYSEPLTNNISLIAYLRNPYGESDRTMKYTFTMAIGKENVVENEKVYAKSINEIQNILIDMCKAYGIKSDINIISKGQLVTAKVYNELYNTIKLLNDKLNDFVDNDKFDYTLISKEVKPNDPNDDYVWEKLITDITNM